MAYIAPSPNPAGLGIGLGHARSGSDFNSQYLDSSSSRGVSPALHSRHASSDTLLQPDHVHVLGQDVAENNPQRREYIVAENPGHAVDAPVGMASSLQNPCLQTVSLLGPLLTASASFEPHPVGPDEAELQDLTFRPTILATASTLTLTALYLAVAAGVGVLWWRAGVDHQFHISSENVHMIARYFPATVGTITVLLFQQTIREFLRIKPFIAMADQKGKPTPGSIPWKSVSGGFFPWQDIFITPGLTSLLSLTMQFLVSFIVSLKVALLATQIQNDTWTLTVRTIPAVALVLGYVTMALYTAFITIKLAGMSTGLKWDPVSIADFVALFSKCNATEYFEPLELRHGVSAKDAMSDEQWFRIGYWDKRKTNRDDEVPEIIYGIGVAFGGQQTSVNWVTRQQDKKYANENAKGRNKALLKEPVPMDSSERGCECELWPNCEHYPYRQNPGVSRWYLVACVLVVWSAFAMSIYSLTRGWPQRGFNVPNNWSLPTDLNMNATLIGHTINLDLTDPSDPKATLLVYAILFRSIPAYIAGMFINTIIPSVDLNMRFMQPFVEMLPIVKQPGQAAKTVLLDYITLSSLQVPLTAYANKHYKVSWFSTLNTISPLFPIFVGGLLTVAPSPNAEHVHLSFSLSAYIGIMVSLIIYSISLPFGFPHAHRLLPRQFYSMADLMAMCHASRFMASPHLDITHRRKCPTKAHMEARILISRDEFKFGNYLGRDNKMHLGFDISATEKFSGSGNIVQTNLVNWIPRASEKSDYVAPGRAGIIRSNTIRQAEEGRVQGRYARVGTEQHEMESVSGQTSATDQSYMSGARPPPRVGFAVQRP